MSAELRIIEPNGIRFENVQAEQNVLGSILIDNDAVISVATILQPEDFADPVHQRLYRVILDLYHRHIPAGLVMLETEIRRKDVNIPIDYLTQLFDATVTSQYANYYAEIVKDTSLRRTLLAMTHDITEIIYNEDDTQAAVAEAFARISDVQSGGTRQVPWTMKELTGVAYDEEGKEQESRVSTGFIDLDKRIGGYEPGQLIIPAARPGLGKTSFQIGGLYHLGFRQRIPAGMISLEMSAKEMFYRMVAIRTGINMHVYRNSTDKPDDVQQRVTKAYGQLHDAPIYIDDSSDGSLSDVMSRARLMHATYGIQALFIDYLQEMSGTRRENRNQELSEITRGLKQLARQLRIPVIVASQFNRALETRQGHEPQLSDLRDSGSIEQAADIVIFIHHPYIYDKQEPENVAKFIVAKHRNGPTATFPMTWLPKQATFGNYAEIGQ